MDKIALIYTLTNTVNGKRYVGFTTNLKRRLESHRSRAGKYDFHLSHAIQKYGWEKFTCEVVASGKDIDHMKNVMEPYFIKLYDTYHANEKGYNMTYGGEGTFGYKRTPEQLKHMSDRQKACKRVYTPEQRKKISEQTSGKNNPNYGKKHSPETLAKISAGIKANWKGGEWTPERRARMSVLKKEQAAKATREQRYRLAQYNIARRGQKGIPHTEEHKAYMSKLMSGKSKTPEFCHLTSIGHSMSLWIIRSPNGTTYEACSINAFAERFGLSPLPLEKTFRLKRPAKRGISKGWIVLDMQPLTEQDRNFYRSFPAGVGVLWRIIPSIT